MSDDDPLGAVNFDVLVNYHEKTGTLGEEGDALLWARDRIAELEQRQEPQTGAIVNGLAFLERLKSNHWFIDEYGKELAKTPDFIELERCLQHLQGEQS